MRSYGCPVGLITQRSVVQIHPPQPNSSSTYGRLQTGALSTSTETSTEIAGLARVHLRSRAAQCNSDFSSVEPAAFLVRGAILRGVCLAANCRRCALNK